MTSNDGCVKANFQIEWLPKNNNPSNWNSLRLIPGIVHQLFVQFLLTALYAAEIIATCTHDVQKMQKYIEGRQKEACYASNGIVLLAIIQLNTSWRHWNCVPNIGWLEAWCPLFSWVWNLASPAALFSCLQFLFNKNHSIQLICLVWIAIIGFCAEAVQMIRHMKWIGLLPKRQHIPIFLLSNYSGHPHQCSGMLMQNHLHAPLVVDVWFTCSFMPLHSSRSEVVNAGGVAPVNNWSFVCSWYYYPRQEDDVL